MYFGEPFGGLIPGSQGAVLSVLLRTDAPLTGRQIHGLVSDRHSLWSVQQCLKQLAELGVIHTKQIGRAGVHTINENHFVVSHLRAIENPMKVLRELVAEHIDPQVESVILFGSLARGEATTASDVDLAVVTKGEWSGGPALEDAVQAGLGNACDVLVLSKEDLDPSQPTTEPVVGDILHEGMALYGDLPTARSNAN